jgi:peptide/nickel transport system ATP-binding protein
MMEIEKLRVDYGAVRALDGVSLSIDRGEIVGLAGESGSGKSTVALAILRLLRAPAVITGGRIRFDGRDVLSMSELELRRFRWRRVSLVTQSAMNALNPVMRIGEQLADAIIEHEGETRRAALRRAGELLEQVDLERSRLRSFPHQLSGGQRQRVVIAMALALRPPLVIMDEPTTALDVVVQREILDEIAALQKELGFSVLLISHDLAVMRRICHRVAVLYAGRLAEAAATPALGAHPYTRALLDCFAYGARNRDRLVGIPGAPPDLRSPPGGCRFHPRCAQRLPTCADRSPPLLRLAPGHEVACHLPCSAT